MSPAVLSMNRPNAKLTRLNGLYVITSAPRHLILARAALRGGVRLIQLRDHQMKEAQLRAVARELRQLTREFDALLFVCDHLELAREIEADGVHLEYSPLSLGEARQQIGETMLLSTGASTIERAIAAQQAGADYLGVGPVFPTQTKQDAPSPIGWNGLETIRAAVSLPLAAIGGLNETNIARAPTAMASVVSALANLETEFEIEAMTRALVAHLNHRQ